MGVAAAANKPHAKLGLPSLKETWTKSMKNTGRGGKIKQLVD